MGENNTKLIRSSLNLIVIAIAAAIIIVSFVVLTNISNPFYIVYSGSMLPTLKPDDIVVVFPVSFDSLRIGDIIVFKTTKFFHDMNYTFLHRVVEISDVNGLRVVKTKGDNNKDSLEGVDYPITTKEYVGKTIFVIPYIGLLAKVLNPPVNFVVVFVLLSSIFLFKIRKVLFH